MKIEIETEMTDHGSLYVAGDVYIDYVKITEILDLNDETPDLDNIEIRELVDMLYESAISRGLCVYKDAYDMYGVSRGEF